MHISKFHGRFIIKFFFTNISFSLEKWINNHNFVRPQTLADPNLF